MLRAFGLAVLVLGAAAALTGGVEKSDEVETPISLKNMAKLIVVAGMVGAGGADAKPVLVTDPVGKLLSIAKTVGGRSLQGFGRGVAEVTAMKVGRGMVKEFRDGTSLNIAKGAVLDAVDQVQLALEKGGLKSFQGPGGIYEIYTDEESEAQEESMLGFDAKLKKSDEESEAQEESMLGFDAKLEKSAEESEAQEESMLGFDAKLKKSAAKLKRSAEESEAQEESMIGFDAKLKKSAEESEAQEESMFGFDAKLKKLVEEREEARSNEEREEARRKKRDERTRDARKRDARLKQLDVESEESMFGFDAKESETQEEGMLTDEEID